MRIAVDAMGGDYAPREVVRGTVAAARARPDVEMLLFGEEPALRREVQDSCGAGGLPANVTLHPSEGNVAMDEEPVAALRKKPRNPITLGLEAVRAGEAGAFVSAGNTGAAVAACALYLKLLPGVKRPGIAAILPTVAGPCTVIDVGANLNCRPVNLYQYGIMGSTYSTLVLGRKEPRVGILSVGEEDSKGNALVKEARRLFQGPGGNAAVNFQGNAEGRDIFSGRFDVVVCEGFVGNAILKVAEGLSESLVRAVAGEAARLKSAGSDREAAGVKEAMGRLREQTDYAETGGAPLLGCEGICIIAHGRSDARAVANACRVAISSVEHGVNSRITEALAAHAA
ncbi:MAG: phosphate acyltransferase PlsX [Planctomycetales bacterium]|nr:phosphate acyltransferase PlsX [Planctomycetales bacterium]